MSISEYKTVEKEILESLSRRSSVGGTCTATR